MSRLIYVNAGHGKAVDGGRDPGAVGPTGLKEADVTQDIADRVENLLRAKGYRTDGKKTESLVEAYKAANASKADVMVSIHCDSVASAQANGTSTFYHGAGSLRLATSLNQHIIGYITGEGGKWLGPTPLRNRGVKQARFAVIRNTTMPSCLVEVAFISNPREEQLLRNKFFKQEIAQAIADGVDAFLKGR